MAKRSASRQKLRALRQAWDDDLASELWAPSVLTPIDEEAELNSQESTEIISTDVLAERRAEQQLRRELADVVALNWDLQRELAATKSRMGAVATENRLAVAAASISHTIRRAGPNQDFTASGQPRTQAQTEARLKSWHLFLSLMACVRMLMALLGLSHDSDEQVGDNCIRVRVCSRVDETPDCSNSMLAFASVEKDSSGEAYLNLRRARAGAGIVASLLLRELGVAPIGERMVAMLDAPSIMCPESWEAAIETGAILWFEDDARLAAFHAMLVH